MTTIRVTDVLSGIQQSKDSCPLLHTTPHRDVVRVKRQLSRRIGDCTCNGVNARLLREG